MCHCGDYPQPEFHNCNFVRGKTSHRCCECLRMIAVGEMQEYACGKWDGEFAAFRTCMACVDMRAEMDLDCWCYAGMVDEVSGGDYDELESVSRFKERRQANYECILAEKHIKQ